MKPVSSVKYIPVILHPNGFIPTVTDNTYPAHLAQLAREAVEAAKSEI
ncbi:hypothetical protein [Pseudanabaena sp. FACHB-2040]|nr:hypothetical protein [Pseudanabaena sp. FACHB-2040]